MNSPNQFLEALPIAIYTTDAEGRITFYNGAAAELWGCRPELGSSQWCGSWRLFWPDGRPMPHDQCPMAVALKEGHEIRGVEAIAERPDGTRVPFVPFPTVIRDDSGQISGAINMLVDVTDQKTRELELAQRAAIVDGSNDAIITKTLTGRITSWNPGATRIFGYTAREMIGKPITILIPVELHHEEDRILAQLARGERIEHYETVRLTKDGRRIDISLTISPLRDRSGEIVGASKIARDISDKKRSEEMQRLLFQELNHRVKNTLATIQSIASQSLRRSANPSDFVSAFNGRVQALARAHDVLVEGKMRGAELSDLLHEQVLLGTSNSRISCSGPSLTLEPRAAVHWALVLHELATNARKYGALAVPDGRLSIAWTVQGDAASRILLMKWEESGVNELKAPAATGFGTTLIERTLTGHGGEVSMRYEVDGLKCELRFPLPPDTRVGLHPEIQGEFEAPSGGPRPQFHRRRRVLVVEDEPLVAMDMEAELTAAGYEVVGPAGTVENAIRVVEEERCDAALLDVKLGSDSAEEVAAVLAQRRIPFSFVTGYGRGGLPPPFGDRPVLVKPIDRAELLSTLDRFFNVSSAASSKVVFLREGDG